MENTLPSAYLLYTALQLPLCIIENQRFWCNGKGDSQYGAFVLRKMNWQHGRLESCHIHFRQNISTFALHDGCCWQTSLDARWVNQWKSHPIILSWLFVNGETMEVAYWRGQAFPYKYSCEYVSWRTSLVGTAFATGNASRPVTDLMLVFL